MILQACFVKEEKKKKQTIETTNKVDLKLVSIQL